MKLKDQALIVLRGNLTPTQREAMLLIVERESRRDHNGLNELMEKYTNTRAAGLELNERDQNRLLMLLLDEVLRGTGGYPV
jgi:hypothetical protein